MEDDHSILENIGTEETEAPYLQKLFTGIADGIIEVMIIIGIYFLLPKDLIAALFALNAYMRYIIAFFVIFAYRFICMLLSGKTIGMILSRSKYLNKKLLPLSPKERLTAVFLTGAVGIKLYKAS